MEHQSYVCHTTFFHHNYQGDLLYYKYDDQMYAPTFPLAWAKDHLPNTGPESCKICNTFGLWNGAFVGYCKGCAEKYNGARGDGFIFYGEEKKNEIENPNAAFSSYLKDVDLDQIGDKNLCDTGALIDEINNYYPDDREDQCCTMVGFGSNYDGGYDSY